MDRGGGMFESGSRQSDGGSSGQSNGDTSGRSDGVRCITFNKRPSSRSAQKLKFPLDIIDHNKL